MCAATILRSARKTTTRHEPSMSTNHTGATDAKSSTPEDCDLFARDQHAWDEGEDGSWVGARGLAASLCVMTECSDLIGGFFFGFLWGARGGVRSHPWDSLFPGSNLPLITPIKLARGRASELGWGGTYNVESRAASFEPFISKVTVFRKRKGTSKLSLYL